MYVFTPFIGFVIHWMISLSIPLLNASAESRTKKAEKRANSRRNDVIWYSRGTPKAIASSLLYRWRRTNNNISLCIYIYPYLNKEIPQSLRHRIISQVLFSYEISLASWRYFPADTYSRSNGDAISSSNTLYIDHDYFIFLQLFLLFFFSLLFFICLFVCFSEGALVFLGSFSISLIVILFIYWLCDDEARLIATKSEIVKILVSSGEKWKHRHLHTKNMIYKNSPTISEQ